MKLNLLNLEVEEELVFQLDLNGHLLLKKLVQDLIILLLMLMNLNLELVKIEIF